MNWNAQLATYMPHGMCLLWQPNLMALHIASDAVIALSYFTIPFALLRFVRGRDDLEPRHQALAILFAAFIGFCGLTHIFSIVVLWLPLYVVEGWLKAATAVVSLVTAVWLIPLVPQALKLPSLKSLQREIAAHRETMIALDTARAALADRVGRALGELRVAEQHRHQSVALLSTVIETVPGLIYATDRSGRMLLANKATLDAIGRPWSQVQGKRADEYLRGQRLIDNAMANNERVMASGQALASEEIVDHPQKGQRVYLASRVPFGRTDGATGQDSIAGMVGVAIDITDSKQLAEDMLHVSRRSAMGELAAAIAHEINQPLAAIAMYLDGSLALLASDNDGATLATPLALAKEQCLRAGEIIRRVRSFVSGEPESRRLENLSHLVDEACSLALIGSHGRGVRISITHDMPDLPVLVDRLQIEQVMVNLIHNALDAIGDAKAAMLRITTGATADGMAVVVVSDNGAGISPDVAGTLFEPFVSTKGVLGMGVGLSVCRTIIEGHGGKIWADPEVATGATFLFSLPLQPGS